MMTSTTTDTVTTCKDLTPSETVSQLRTPRKSLTRWLLRWLLPAMRKSVAQRETTKGLLIELVHQLRLGYRRLAELLVLEGRLPEDELVFFLTHHELSELLERGPCPGLVRKAARRRRIRPQLLGHRYREIHRGMPKPEEVSW